MRRVREKKSANLIVGAREEERKEGQGALFNASTEPGRKKKTSRGKAI